MFAPLYKLGLMGDAGMIVIALLVGFIFGFVLENAGFGNGKIIAGFFYLEDLRVFKMMFTIIITAMILTFLTYYLGFLDLYLVQLAYVFLAPVIVAGLIFGAGMVIGGYCPGTVTVSVATKKIDGIVFLLGFLVGVIIYAETYGLFKKFTTATYMGKLTLTDVTNIPYGIWVFIITIVGVVSFFVLPRFEGKLYKK